MVSPVSNRAAARKLANSLKQDTAKVQASDASSGLVLSNLSAQTKLPFACGLCGQLFAQLLMLEKHRCKRQYAGSSGQRFLLPKPFPEPSAAVMTTAEQLAANTSGYLCGECGENFVDETAVYSHMLSKHMSVSKVQGQKGEVQVVSIGNPSTPLMPSSTEDAEVDVKPPASDNVKNNESIKQPTTGQRSCVKKKRSVPVSSSVVNGSDFDTDQDVRSGEDVKPGVVVKGRGPGRPRKNVLAKKMPGLCAICGKMFSCLKEHMQLHQQHQQLEFQCADCGRKFARKDYLADHRRIHSNDRRYLCVICGSRFRTSGNLKNHLRMHTDERRFQCDQCPKRFRKMSGLKDHIQIVHDHIRAYKCDLCQRDYASARGLKLHLMSHRNERPCACSMCPKRFKDNPSLQVHMVTHTGERRFPCSICGRRFTQKSAAVIHEATQHTIDGGRIHECYLCGQRFNKRTIRDAHIRRHQGIKPYGCTMCNWTFPFIGDLRNHMKKRHKVKRERDTWTSAGRLQKSVE